MKNKKSTLVVSALVRIIIAVVVLFLVVIPACNKIRSLSADSSSLVVDRSSGAPLPGQMMERLSHSFWSWIGEQLFWCLNQIQIE